MQLRKSPIVKPAVRVRSVAALALALALAACASTPPTRLHTLMPAQSAPRAAGTSGAPIALLLEPIRIPAQVDQPQWLVRLPNESLAILEQERWAGPLQDELRQALLEELGGRFGVVEATAGVGAPLRARLDVRRFDSLPGREARIEGSWLLTGADARAPAARCEWRLRETAPGDIAELAKAHRRAVVRLAGALGENVSRLSRGEPATCPVADSP